MRLLYKSDVGRTGASALVDWNLAWRVGTQMPMDTAVCPSRARLLCPVDCNMDMYAIFKDNILVNLQPQLGRKFC